MSIEKLWSYDTAYPGGVITDDSESATVPTDKVGEAQRKLDEYLTNLPPRIGNQDGSSWIGFREERLELDGPDSLVSLLPEDLGVTSQQVTRYVGALIFSGARTVPQLASMDIQTFRQVTGKKTGEFAQILRELAIATLNS